jgi:hypothetical protein
MSIVFIISGPSGSGKSSLVELLLRFVPGLHFSVSYTTRPPRGSERDGHEYFFVAMSLNAWSPPTNFLNTRTFSATLTGLPAVLSIKPKRKATISCLIYMFKERCNLRRKFLTRLAFSCCRQTARNWNRAFRTVVWMPKVSSSADWR